MDLNSLLNIWSMVKFLTGDRGWVPHRQLNASHSCKLTQNVSGMFWKDRAWFGKILIVFERWSMFQRDRACLRGTGHVPERQCMFLRHRVCFGEMGPVMEIGCMFWTDGQWVYFEWCIFGNFEAIAACHNINHFKWPYLQHWYPI